MLPLAAHYCFNKPQSLPTPHSFHLQKLSISSQQTAFKENMPSRDDSPLHAMMASSSSLSVQSLRARVPFVSQSALTSILDIVDKEGVPEQRKRKHIYDSTRRMLERMCLYGPLVITAVAHTLSDQAVEITYIYISCHCWQEHMQWLILGLITLTRCMVSFPAAMPILGASSATQSKYTQVINWQGLLERSGDCTCLLYSLGGTLANLNCGGQSW